MSRDPSPETDALVRKRLIGLALVVLIGGGGVWYVLSRDAGVIGGEIIVEARFPASLVLLPDGRIRYGERLTGQIREISQRGDLSAEPVAEVEISIGGQRGLLGVAVDDRGRTFAAWTRPDLTLVVGQVDPGPQRLVWQGPPTSDLAIGGHLDFDEGGRIVIGVGDLQDPQAVVDPSLPNGKVLALDPDGSPDQDPETISGGWNNPFAFAFGDDGRLWIADNSPGDAPERLARGDRDARAFPVTELPENTVPAGLAVEGERIYLCGFGSRRLIGYRIHGDNTVRDGPALATNCSLGVKVRPDGTLIYTNEGTVFALDPGDAGGSGTRS